MNLGSEPTEDKPKKSMQSLLVEKWIYIKSKERSYELNNYILIEEVLEDLKAGKPVIIVDDESRENEGDLIIAAEFATQENINFMVKYARGIVCTPMRREALEKLGIPAMVTKNTDNHETAFHRYC